MSDIIDLKLGMDSGHILLAATDHCCIDDLLNLCNLCIKAGEEQMRERAAQIVEPVINNGTFLAFLIRNLKTSTDTRETSGCQKIKDGA